MMEGGDNVGDSQQLSVNKPSAAMIAFVQALARACATRDYRMLKLAALEDEARDPFSRIE